MVLEKLMWSLKSPWKMVAVFCMNPVTLRWKRKLNKRPLLLSAFLNKHRGACFLSKILRPTPPNQGWEIGTFSLRAASSLILAWVRVYRFIFKWRVREMNGNFHYLSPPLHHRHTVNTVATFPIFIKYPVKGLRCHPKYQGMGFTL